MTPDDQVAVRTIGRYQVVGELGRGAMGVVYRGYDPVIGRTVALKTIAIGALAEDAADFRKRLFREAAAAGALAHPNIVTIHDVVDEPGTTAVAMEFVEGETLASIIAMRAPLPLDEALALLDQICAGLDYAAARGIVHRDIKPANILVGKDGRPRVADFGIARLPASSLTMTGVVLGSVGYMSPEQVQGLPLDARSDLFSTATVFYEMLTGRNPFAGTGAANMLYRIVHESPPPLSALNPAVPRTLESVMDRALAKDRALRFPTGAELVRVLRAAAGDAAAAIRSGADPAVNAGPRALSRRFALIVGVAGLAGAAGLGVFVWSQSAPTAVSKSAITAAGAAQPPAAPVIAAGPDRASDKPAGAVALKEAAAPRRKADATGLRARASASTGPDYQPAKVAETPTRIATPPPSLPPPAPGMLVVQFQGDAFPVLIYDGDQQIGQLSADGRVRVAPGSHQIRIVGESAFLTKTYDALSVLPGEPTAVTVPALGSAVASVRGESYAGVRIFVDDRQLAFPYPAQIQRIAAGAHTIRFEWLSGALAGKELKQSFEVRAGGHVLVRAVPENDQVTVQQIR